jgi:diacylglycerol kinase
MTEVLLMLMTMLLLLMMTMVMMNGPTEEAIGEPSNNTTETDVTAPAKDCVLKK